MGPFWLGGLKIYPNPFSQQTAIEFPNPELEEYTVRIRDLTGKLIRIEKTSSNRMIIERGEMAAGIYSIELSGNKIYRNKLVVE